MKSRCFYDVKMYMYQEYIIERESRVFNEHIRLSDTVTYIATYVYNYI